MSNNVLHPPEYENFEYDAILDGVLCTVCRSFYVTRTQITSMLPYEYNDVLLSHRRQCRATQPRRIEHIELTLSYNELGRMNDEALVPALRRVGMPVVFSVDPSDRTRTQYTRTIKPDSGTFRWEDNVHRSMRTFIWEGRSPLPGFTGTAMVRDTQTLTPVYTNYTNAWEQAPVNTSMRRTAEEERRLLHPLREVYGIPVKPVIKETHKIQTETPKIRVVRFDDNED